MADPHIPAIVIGDGERNTTSIKQPTSTSTENVHLDDTTGLPRLQDGRIRFLQQPKAVLLGNYWGRCPDATEISGTQNGQNFMIWRQMKKDVPGIARPAPMTRSQSRPTELIDCLPQRVRRLHLRVYDKMEKKQKVAFFLGVAGEEAKLPQGSHYTQGTMYRVFDKKAGVIAFECSAWRDLSASQMQEVSHHLQRLCERIPVAPLDLSKSSMQFLAEAATRYATGQLHSAALPDIRFGRGRYKNKSKLHIVASITIYTAESLTSGYLKQAAKDNLELDVALEDLVQCHTTPDLPRNFRAGHIPDLLNPDECGFTHEQQLRAIQVMQWLQSMCHGRVFGTIRILSPGSAIHAYKESLLNILGCRYTQNTKRSLRDNIYDGGEMYRVKRHQTHFSVEPMWANFSTIRVPLSVPALIRVIEVMESNWLNTADEQLAWESGAIRADFEEELWRDNEPAPETCQPSDRPRTVKLCRKCFTPTQASKMEQHGEELLCPHCVPAAASLPKVLPPPQSCTQCQTEGSACDGKKPVCTSCDILDQDCSYEQDLDEGSDVPQNLDDLTIEQKATIREQKALVKESSAYRAARYTFDRAFMRDAYDRSYSSDEARNAAFKLRSSMLDRGWLLFCEKFEITKDGWYDVYSRKHRPFTESDESRYPWQMSVDARFSVTIDDADQPSTHAVEHLAPTCLLFNSLKDIFDALIIGLFAELCNDPVEERVRQIQTKIDHLYLMRMQVPWERAKRLEMAANDPLIRAVQEQAAKGEADPESCARILEPWQIGSTEIFSPDEKTVVTKERFIGRSLTSKRAKEFPNLTTVEKILDEIESDLVVKFHRVQGTVYLFNPSNAPAQWNWVANRRHYSYKTVWMTRASNKDYITTVKPDTLLLVQAYQLALPPEGRAWMREMLEPYTHHAFRVSYGHAAHGLDMATGFPENYQSLADFVPEDMNIDCEPWIWNMARGNLDQYQEQIYQTIASVPPENDPYWNAANTGRVGVVPPVPKTSWRDVGPTRGKRKYKTKNKGAKKSAGTKSGQQQKPSKEKPSNRTAQPEGAVARANLSNSSNTCYASSTIQAFYGVEPLRQLVDSSTKFPFNIQTGRGLHGMHMLNDPGFANHQALFDQWRAIMALLPSTKDKLRSLYTLEFMRILRRFNDEFPIGQEGDPSSLCDYLLSALDAAGGRSDYLADGDSRQRPNTKLTDHLDLCNREGRMIEPLSEDAPRHWDAHRQTGHDSSADDLSTLWTVFESECTANDCPSPFSRGYGYERFIALSFPLDSPDYTTTRRYTVTQLIDLWHRSSNQSSCEYDRGHGLRNPPAKKILRLPNVLGIRIERMRLDSLLLEGSGDLEGLESLAAMITNPLQLEAEIDLRAYVQQRLPSEDVLGSMEPAEGITKYGLAAIIQHRQSPKHYVAYAKAPDANGNYFWAKFDDMLPTARFEDPFTKQLSLETVKLLRHR
ncbi:hypothetical protein HII31_10439 [Pseudocercospora fuligena]|uniref:USP domain-containing protein n=1 Tax=Pseudocercospora fuligena TaxID=685502 RepID=A0A8H6RAP3_9PEZI|nr:hypothetical protein HII31_10439 [Pseudocercospora fuligena]